MELNIVSGISIGGIPDAFNEYVVVHEITIQQALKEAKGLIIYPGPKPGCKACTSDEMNYCRNNSVVDDHCVCDSLDEPFGFVEHACKVGPHASLPTALDCSVYTRIRDCCCHSYLASVWKYRAGGAGNVEISQLLLILVVLIQLIGLNR
ncbi:hypothetical protein QAD02_005338 [Eretmocerus hayati]|uniref:Uncharacterized protein n=1 Tax=Eretmocerus hayati TaxID=131215 RepID=A0ACC2NSG1_9HYME|nr:hypothetical protein QAD02_005338 [Eretmocerus hayati]